MNESKYLGFLLRMRKVARESRSRRRRCHYPAESLRLEAVEFLSDVWAAGGTLEDAAEMMSVYKGTLENWLDKATQPSDVQVNVIVNF